MMPALCTSPSTAAVPSDGQPELAPDVAPAGWTAMDTEAWRYWWCPCAPPPEPRFAVHVAALPGHAAPVLDLFAEACFSAGISFKHLITAPADAAGPDRPGAMLARAFCPDPACARRLLALLDGRLAREEGPYLVVACSEGEGSRSYYRWGALREDPRGSGHGGRGRR